MWYWLRRFLQKQFLDRFYHTRAFLQTAVVWLAIRMAGYEVLFANVHRRSSPNRLHADLDLGNAGDLDGLLAHAKAQVTEAITRRSIVTDKCKTLFTFNTALLALIAVFPAKTADLLSWEITLFCLAIAAFVISMLVVWTYFDVGGELVAPLEQDLVGLGRDDLKKSLINTNLRCAADSDNRTDFLVDLYSTSRFFLMVGFVLLFIGFAHNYFARSGQVPKAAEPLKVIVIAEPAK